MKHINSKFIVKGVAVLIFLTCVISTGCSKTDSANVTTKAIFADIKIVGNSKGTTDVFVDLDVGSGLNGTDLELSDGDSLTATANGQTQILSKSSNIMNIEYITTFDTNEADMEVTVSFTRENGLSAPDSKATLPAPFTLTAPTDGDLFGLNDPVIFEWLPVDETSRIGIVSIYTCQNTDAEGTLTTIGTGISERIVDNGFTSYTMRELFGTSSPETYNRGCTLELEVSRSRAGSIDSHFGEGGRIIAKQSETLEIRYDPGLE